MTFPSLSLFSPNNPKVSMFSVFCSNHLFALSNALVNVFCVAASPGGFDDDLFKQYSFCGGQTLLKSSSLQLIKPWIFDMISMPPPRKFLTVPNPLPMILNKLLIGFRKGPMIESITPTIFAVILPINSSTAHAMGFTIPFVIAFFNIFLIVLPNAFFTVEPKHPNASKSLFTGFAAPSENASN